jgi:hypothetical protein
MSNEPHIADAEAKFRIMNINPDFCIVGNATVPFDICQVLYPEKVAYSETVFARGERILLLESVVEGVKGNAGKGVGSTVSLANGDSEVIEGSSTVFIEGRRVARHNDLVEMNVKTIS